MLYKSQAPKYLLVNHSLYFDFYLSDFFRSAAGTKLQFSSSLGYVEFQQLA